MHKKKKSQPELTFKDVYKLPFTRRWGKVMCNGYNMAFDFPMEMIYPNRYPLSDNDKDNIVELLNGKKGYIMDLPLTYNPKDTTIYTGEYPFIVVRGWGNLTGSGGLNLPELTAAKIQDDFANWIVTTLTNTQ